VFGVLDPPGGGGNLARRGPAIAMGAPPSVPEASRAVAAGRCLRQVGCVPSESMSEQTDTQRLLMNLDQQRLVERAERDEQLRHQFEQADRIAESVAKAPAR
jgi:hypothetical protein